jgi:hypothetical protein
MNRLIQSFSGKQVLKQAFLMENVHVMGIKISHNTTVKYSTTMKAAWNEIL